MLGNKKALMVEESLQNMLSKLPKPVAERLLEKYTAEQEEFTAAATEAAPSSEPSYWAKSTCKKCYGRGTIGRSLTEDRLLICRCTRKAYGAWLSQFRKEYNALKSRGVSSDE